MKKRIYLWETIYNRLISKGIKSYEIDIRYLQRWIDLYPCCFPKFVLSGNFEINLVWNKDYTNFRYELSKI
jgi:hypothetical protein